MVLACFCVFWLSLHFFSPLQILRRKMRRHESSGPLPCHDFVFSLGGNKWPMLQPSRSDLYWCALVLQFSLGVCCAKKQCEDRLHTSQTLFSAPPWVCSFWKGPYYYYSAGDFKHFPQKLLMQFNAQSCPALSELQKHWVCLYNQSPANPHDYRNGTLAHGPLPMAIRY